MASTFTWLDHSDEQRRRVLDFVSLFKEKNTVDELGVGTIRDAFADLFFPGTSAPQTRARYFLFVPWTYLRLEAARTPSVEIAGKARREEVRLIHRLLETGSSDGVIGRLAKRDLQRLPSSIYWSGLRRLGICLFDGSQDAYHKSLDSFYRRGRTVVRTDDGELVGRAASNWHTVPDAPAEFPDKVSLDLTREEAEYLRDRIAVSAPLSLFAHLVRATRSNEHADFPWAHPRRGEFSDLVVRQLSHAQNFSELVHGAALLYNLILAEMVSKPDLIERYRDDLDDWTNMVDARLSELERWHPQEFWACVESGGARIGQQTRRFVEGWWALSLRDQGFRSIADSAKARDLIKAREIYLKGPLARVRNGQALRAWGGASGTEPLTYRWPNASRISKDILSALEGHARA